MQTKQQTAVGAFVLLGLICLAWLTIRLGKMEVLESSGFELSATFNSVSGLRAGADVEISGVAVGRVTAITLSDDPNNRQAIVHLRLDKDLKLANDTIASVKTSGLIGDKYISLSPGGSEDILKAGDVISETEGAMDLESILSKFAHGGV